MEKTLDDVTNTEDCELTTSKTHEEVKKSSGEDGNLGEPQIRRGEDEKTRTVPFYKLFAFADSVDVLLMTVGSVSAIANGLSMPLCTVLFGQLTDELGQNQKKLVLHSISKLCAQVMYLAVGTGLAAFLQVSCWMITGERQAARLRSLYLKSVLGQEVGFFDTETKTGDVVGRMSGDTVIIQEAMGEKVGKFLQLVSAFVGGYAIALIKGWLLTIVLLSSLPLLVLAGAVMSIMMARMASLGQNAYTEAANMVEQTIGSIRTVQSFTGEKKAIECYKKFLVAAYKSIVREGIASGFGLGLVMSTAFFTYSMSIWYGAKLILENGYTGGRVFNVILAVLNGSQSLGQASSCVTAFAAGKAAAYKMFETINRKPEIDAYELKGKILEDIQGEIELRDVYFSYPARPNEQIFCGFSLSIPSGTTAALVGQSGSGKSTIINLIERFYDPQNGEVLVDGINLREFQLKWIRQKIGLVSQEPVLFTSSIKDNIACGKDGATTEEIRAALQQANAAQFIDKLPQGLDTMVGEHGTQLSGGQKQRVAIARAIIKDPRILLLDEATSALDAESERVVQEALDRIMVNRTTVIVAHRLSTVKNADMIAVIHRGKMVEKGGHWELIKNTEGAYSQLVRLQEVNKDTKQAVDDQDKSSLNSDSFRKSSRTFSIGSLAVGNSSRYFLPVSIDLPTAIETLPEETVPKPPLRRLAALNKAEFPVLIAGTIAAMINGLIFPIFGWLLAKVTKTFYEMPHELRKDSKFYSSMVLILGVVSLILYPWQSYLFSVAGGKLIQRIRCMCFEKVVHMEIAWFDEPGHSSGLIGTRLSEDAVTARALVGDALAQMVQNTSSAIAALVIAFSASWQLAIIVIVLFPLIVINGFLQVKFMKGFSGNAKMMYEEANQIASNAVASIRTVASFCAEKKMTELYKRKCDVPVMTGIKQGLLSGSGFGLSFFMMFSVYTAIFYAAAQLIDHGKTTFVDFYQVFFVLATAATTISQSSSFSIDSSKTRTAAASMFAILDRKSKIESSDESGMTLDHVKGQIEIRHVSFKYPSRPEVQIFRDLSLAIHCGKTVALVGASGSGKSTAIALLQRFYDPDSGHITLDGIEIQKFQIKWLRRQMGLVSQEPVLFNDTIRANIAYGKGGDATEAEILAASELVNAHQFISSLQQGYDTVAGERGVQLSGGQKQRVAIARAIVKDPKILLLDEATSSLDAESERVVQDALDRVMVNRTTIVVAHRLSTIKNADVIAVVKDGVIVEEGKHEKLIKIKDGFYSSLVTLHRSPST
ncbi:hypothetical protein K2173_004880 [Erythroxylum novogranatense]|uniref:Uncharacterized protein n=1 Tax=Erythroxylum novogranatense TaxID=1862640 RepID=A0AAV8UD42_9ROSI|nr:hypothetical protein K2173_004880 [Erythroxylum novogranatense]